MRLFLRQSKRARDEDCMVEHANPPERDNPVTNC